MALGAFAFSGCGEKEDGKASYALVTTGVASFWDICKKGGEDAGKELGVDVEVLMPTSGDDQKSKLEDLLAKGVDGIAVAAIDPINQAGLFDEVAKNSILITMDTDAPTTKRQVYVGMDNYDAGWMCGELVKEAIPDGGEVVLFIGRLEQDNAKRRRQGVIDCLLGREKDASRYDAPGQPQIGTEYTVLATLTDQFDRAKGKANVEDMLTKHEGVDAMVGLFAYNPPLILEALKQAGRIGEVKVIGFDKSLCFLRQARILPKGSWSPKAPKGSKQNISHKEMDPIWARPGTPQKGPGHPRPWSQGVREPESQGARDMRQGSTFTLVSTPVRGVTR